MIEMCANCLNSNSGQDVPGEAQHAGPPAACQGADDRPGKCQHQRIPGREGNLQEDLRHKISLLSGSAAAAAEAAAEAGPVQDHLHDEERLLPKRCSRGGEDPARPKVLQDDFLWRRQQGFSRFKGLQAKGLGGDEEREPGQRRGGKESKK